ncbi:RNA polymerase sigma factor [Dactylosporangium darangshiense]|uniref:RNA polymerase ECF-subfamily sigma factor n=1 Tax=Dactylosporangium darangshiense TaxID=579108 RepID=A0ABP8D9P7_9ACTN
MSGREERFRALHRDTYADLLRFVERRVPEGEAEDIVSTVYLTAWRRFADMPSDARPWLFAVARNTMANGARGWLRRRALDVRLAAREPLDTEDNTAAAATRIDLDRAWRSLTAADREVLALVAFDGLTTEQAATVLGCRRTTYAMRLTRARQRLRAALDGPAAPTPAITRTEALKERSWTQA